MAGERLLAQFAVPFEIRGREFFVTPSIGVALAPDTDTSAEAILRDADIAMYRAKARGKGQLAVFEPEMRMAMHDRMALQADLRGAVERDEFRLLYQPVVEIGTRRLVGAEALLRWQHPTRGLLTPADFLLVRADAPELTPGDLTANLVYAASGSVVDTTVVAGRVLMRGGQIGNEAEVRDGAIARTGRGKQ